MGGTSSINGMVALRGHRSDYDSWRDEGLLGWSYDDVLPYFRKLENSWRGENLLHGVGGPVTIEPGVLPSMMFDALADTARNSGHSVCDDPAHPDHDGLVPMELSTRNGRRHSTSVAYLGLARGRHNLSIRTGALFHRLVMDGLKTTGVVYDTGAGEEKAIARREVILSGGAYGSPQMLMLSGIGPAGHLGDMGIPIVRNLPSVGGNLSEHARYNILFASATRETLLRELRLDRAVLNIAAWLLGGTGVFRTNATPACLFAKSGDELPWPDLEIILSAIGLDSRLWFPGLTEPPVHRFAAAPLLLYPRSRGKVWLRSAIPQDPPNILFNLLTEEEDMRRLRSALKVTRAFFATKPIAGLVSRELTPGPYVSTDSEIDAFLRENVSVDQHPVGTCRMGVGKDAVVDPDLRVHGISGLRVVDASVMPSVPGGNTNIPTIMIAEKAADLILKGLAQNA